MKSQPKEALLRFIEEVQKDVRKEENNSLLFINKKTPFLFQALEMLSSLL